MILKEINKFIIKKLMIIERLIVVTITILNDIRYFQDNILNNILLI